MIDPQTYSASVNNNQGEPRMAGYVPVVGQQKQVTEAQSFSNLVQQTQNANSATPANTAAQQGSSSSSSSHHGFLDFLTTIFDIINPLEHIPVISTIYEHVTGHHMNPIARIAGDTLYGGPIGTAVGVANVISERKTGKDLGDNVLAMISGHGGAKDSGTALAQNASAAPNIIWDNPTAAASATTAAAPAATPATTPAAKPAGAPATAPSAIPVAAAGVMASAAAAAKLAPAAGAAASTSGAGAAAQAKPNLRQHFPSIAATPSHGAKESGKTLADYSVIRTPLVLGAKDRASAAGGWPDSLSSRQTDSTPGSSVQDAPADALPGAVPPGQIAQKMMEGLDKYAALKKEQMSPAYSATF